MNSDGPRDHPPDDPEGGRWMTVAELGQYRGTSKASAARYIRRKRWRRQTDNRGIVRVLVPPNDADSPQDGPAPAGPPSLVVLRAAIAALTARTEAAEQRADRAEARADRAEARADRAEAGRDADRARADVLADRVHVLQAERDQAFAVAREAVQAAEAGRADAAEQARQRATTAQEGAAALRQTDAARRQASLLARLRAACVDGGVNPRKSGEI